MLGLPLPRRAGGSRPRSRSAAVIHATGSDGASRWQALNTSIIRSLPADLRHRPTMLRARASAMPVFLSRRTPESKASLAGSSSGFGAGDGAAGVVEDTESSTFFLSFFLIWGWGLSVRVSCTDPGGFSKSLISLDCGLPPLRPFCLEFFARFVTKSCSFCSLSDVHSPSEISKNRSSFGLILSIHRRSVTPSIRANSPSSSGREHDFLSHENCSSSR